MSGAGKKIMLKELIPEGIPTAEHFEIVDVTIGEGDLAEGDLLLQTLVLSADPYMRGGFKDGAVPRPVAGFVAGKVVASNSAAWPVGSFLGAHLPYVTLQVVTAAALGATMAWNLTEYVTEETISRGIGVLGMPGATAYGGLMDVLRPEAGETLFVSAAAGAVGGLVGQIAKRVVGCKVVGACGGAAKGVLVKEKYGFDAAIDYKTTADAAALGALLKGEAPDGIDMYFENVGGMHFDAAFAALRPGGRIAVCGAIAGYNHARGTAPTNVIDITKMIYTRQRIEGFVCHPWLTGAKGNFLPDMAKWLSEGKVHVEETAFDGVGAFPEAFAALFTGANTGKVVVRTAGDATLA